MRYRFVTAALESCGHSVSLVALHPPARFLRQACAILTSPRHRPGPAAVILVGLGPKMLAVYAAARIARLPVIARLGGDPVRTTKSRAFAARAARRYIAWAGAIFDRWTRAWLLRRVDGCLVVNGAMRDALRPYLPPSVPIAVAPQFCPGPGEQRPSYRLRTPVTLLTVTNLLYCYKLEGVLWIVDRLAELAAEGACPPLDFRIAGGGVHLADLRRALADRRLPQGLTVTPLGFVTEMGALWPQADIFLYRSEHDGTPNVLLEARRSGLPALANTCAEFREIVTDGVDGLLYGNENEFRAQLRRLLHDEDLRRALGEAALADHRRRFCIEASGALLEAALARILDPGPPGTPGPAGLTAGCK